MTNASIWNTKGFVTVSLVAFVPLILLVLIAGVGLALRSQNRLALLFRLDTCAVEVMDNRLALVSQLNKTNQAMMPLRVAVYAARGSKVVSAGLSTIGEAAALIALKTLAQSQNALVLKAKLEDGLHIRCEGNKFSLEMALCQFPLTQMPTRQPALFPDVPGDLDLNELKNFAIKCGAKPNLLAQLKLQGQNYVYQK